ncbi:MAG TPA: MFS transporter, partial [Acidimicrobiales bacterium]
MGRTGSGFGGLWLATGLANLADGLYLIALPLVALELTASPAAVAGVTVMLTAAWPLFGLHAGGIVDRVDRRRLMVAVNLVRAAALGALTLAVASGVA